MKVTVNNTTPTQEKPFPKLMITNEYATVRNRIVLFLNEKVGTCLQVGSADTREVGEYVTTWDMEMFTDFNGSITLSND
jgi:hypothetical protein